MRLAEDRDLRVASQSTYNRRAVVEDEWNQKIRETHGVRQLGPLAILGINVRFLKDRAAVNTAC